VPAFVKNRPVATTTPEHFRGFLQAWQKFFPTGDQLLFEYYNCGPLNQYDLARVIHSDVAELKRLGFNGLVNCQAQRVFFPTGLPCYVLGQSLWNSAQNLDALRDDYFSASFGQDGGACKEFIKVSAEVLNRTAHLEGRLVLTPAAPAELAKLTAMITDFERVISRNSGETNPCRSRSWFYMGWYARMLRELAGLYRVMLTGTPAEVQDTWQKTRAFLMTVELHCQPVFDFWSFVGFFDRHVVHGYYSSAPQDVVQEDKDTGQPAHPPAKVSHRPNRTPRSRTKSR